MVHIPIVAIYADIESRLDQPVIFSPDVGIVLTFFEHTCNRHPSRCSFQHGFSDNVRCKGISQKTDTFLSFLNIFHNSWCCGIIRGE